MQPPRILIWFWSGGGGGSEFAANLAHRLTTQFGDVVALSMRADDPTLALARAKNVRVLEAAVTSDRKRPLASLASLAASGAVLEEHIRQTDADLVCIPMNFAVAAPLSQSVRAPIVYCAHDARPHPGDFEIAAQKLTQGWLLKRAARVVALSQHTADQLAGDAPKEKLRVAPLSSVFEPKPAASPSVGMPVRLVFLGRMMSYKGVDLLADAVDRIASRIDWRLTIAGCGPAMTDAMKARFHHPQIEPVRDAWLSTGEVDRLIASSDVVLAPYREASQSGVVSQALAWGKPIVVTPVGALQEQIGEGRAGWIAKTASAEAFAAAIVEMLEDAAVRTAKAEAAAEIARAAWTGDHWSWLAREFGR